MIHTLEELYRQDLRNEMNVITDSVATNEELTIEKVRHLQGVIKGLAVAERFFLDRMQQAREALDD